MLLNTIFTVLYVSWIVTEILVLTVTRTRSGGGTISDRGSLRVLWVTITASLALGMWVGAAYRPTAMGRAGVRDFDCHGAGDSLDGDLYAG